MKGYWVHDFIGILGLWHLLPCYVAAALSEICMSFILNVKLLKPSCLRGTTHCTFIFINSTALQFLCRKEIANWLVFFLLIVQTSLSRDLPCNGFCCSWKLSMLTTLSRDSHEACPSLSGTTFMYSIMGQVCGCRRTVPPLGRNHNLQNNKHSNTSELFT